MEKRRIARTLKEEETDRHFDMLNLAYAPWGNTNQWHNKYGQPDFDVTKSVIVVEEDGNWIGGGTAWFRDVLIGENTVRAYTPGDLYTHPDHEGKGVYSTAMRGLNKLAQESGAALGITFPSIEDLPFQALPKYGFCDIFHPKMKIKLLKPEALGSLLEGRKIAILRRFEGETIKLIIESHEMLFQVKSSSLARINGSRKPDITVKANLQTLLGIYSSSKRSKGKFVLSAIGALFKRRLSVKMSVRDLVKSLSI